jgi:hypothetical protein
LSQQLVPGDHRLLHARAGAIMTFIAIVAGAAATMKWQYWRLTRQG